MSPPRIVRFRPSLRRRLLIFLLIPMAALLFLDALLTYGVACRTPIAYTIMI